MIEHSGQTHNTKLYGDKCEQLLKMPFDSASTYIVATVYAQIPLGSSRHVTSRLDTTRHVRSVDPMRRACRTAELDTTGGTR